MFGVLNNKYKSELCRHFETSPPSLISAGQCHMGNRCHFAHGKAELRKITDVAIVIMKPLPVSPSFEGMQTPYGTPFSNYKTVTCKYYEQGCCKFDQFCTFAHGNPEMRSIVGTCQYLK